MYLTKEEIAKKYPNAHIGSGAHIESNAVIGRGRKNVSSSIVVLGIGRTKNITAYVCSKGLRINIGCMNGHKGYSLKKTKEEIAKKYESDHEYFIALKMIKRWCKRINQTQTS